MSRYAVSRVVLLALTGVLAGRMAAAQTAPADPAPQPKPVAPVAPASASGETPAKPDPPRANTPQTPAVDPPPVTEADVERIKNHLQVPTTLKLDEQQLRFYVQILGKQQSFAKYAKGYDFVNGGTKGGNPMTHAEFLSMVTPREFYSSGGITATELLQGAIVNWLGQALIKKALEDISQAHDEKSLREIRDRIERELAALKKGGG